MRTRLTLLALLAACGADRSSPENGAEEAARTEAPRTGAAERYQAAFVGDYAEDSVCAEGPDWQLTPDGITERFPDGLTVRCSIGAVSEGPGGALSLSLAPCMPADSSPDSRTLVLREVDETRIEIERASGSLDLARCE